VGNASFLIQQRPGQSPDEDVDQIEVVGDLIRHIENVNNDWRRSIVEASLQ
jgi:hypothetical protein